MSRENMSFPAFIHEALSLEYTKLKCSSDTTPEEFARIYVDAVSRISAEIRNGNDK